VTRCVVLIVCLCTGVSGCANTWDKVSSNKFRKDPYGTMFDRRDALTILRTSVEGDERAAAMRKLTEPAAKGGSQDEQDEVLSILSQAATTDPSPVVRVAAIDALGKFRDPRAVENLVAAYHQSTGSPPSAGKDRNPLAGPIGFPPDVVSLLKSRSVDSLAQTGRTEAVPMLAEIATGKDEKNPVDRDTRIAAVRGLSKLNSSESMLALSRVMGAEKTRDPAIANRAQEGLVALTGQNVGNDPEKWQAVIQAGQVAPVAQTNFIQQAVNWMLGQ
jgi:HEAT repeats